MAYNPAKQEERLNSPVERASNVNDPQFENQQGYFAYDLTHQEFITPLFGQITPTMNLDTVPADRTVVKDNTKLILNQINGNFLSTLNQYVDTFYVPLRNVFPTNYEKLIPNPVKGADLPNSALPQVPLLAFLKQLYDSNVLVTVDDGDGSYAVSLQDIGSQIYGSEDMMSISTADLNFYLGHLTLLATIMSRGQLLDYFGFQLGDSSSDITSRLQSAIDEYFRQLYRFYTEDNSDGYLGAVTLNLNQDEFMFGDADWTYPASTLSQWRSSLADILEAGKVPVFTRYINSEHSSLAEAISRLQDALGEVFSGVSVNTTYIQIEQIDEDSDPFANGHCFNIGKILAYQQVVAHYFSNDHVDNIYSSDLYMQNLRSIMFPTEEGAYKTTEPVFSMNGVNYEYDYISYGAWWSSFFDISNEGRIARTFVTATLLFLLRRSLRYGDYFSTARPNMLAVSDQLGISTDSGMVSPIDITKNLLMQRYLNAANYVAQGFLQYMASIYGVKPSDTGCTPRFITHRKIELQNQITNNTGDNQGAQTTNIVGYADEAAFDVFIDDFGYLISVTSFDVLPVYKTGIDPTLHYADRFDYFNPMLQGIGDQSIRVSELTGRPSDYNSTFGYTMRNGELKFKTSRAHGAFVNSLPGFMVSYPMKEYIKIVDGRRTIQISPDFIRDKAIYLDPVVPQMTGVSPGEYFHFIVSCTNQVQCARKIQATPGVLF